MTASIPLVMEAALAPLGVMVQTKVPSPRPPELIRIVDAGGPEITDEALDWANVTWEVWAKSEKRAGDLAGEVRDQINHMSGDYAGAFVTTAKATRPRSFYDEVSGTPRYVGTARLLVQLG